MSATRDKNQKPVFVYSNLYHAYRKGLDAARASGAPVGLTRGKVLKADDLRAREDVRIERHNPPALLGRSKVVDKPAVLSSARQEQGEALQSLRDNLKSLTDLHARLRFMLKELEDLVKD